MIINDIKLLISAKFPYLRGASIQEIADNFKLPLTSTFNDLYNKVFYGQ